VWDFTNVDHDLSWKELRHLALMAARVGLLVWAWRYLKILPPLNRQVWRRWKRMRIRRARNANRV